MYSYVKGLSQFTLVWWL